MTLQFVEMDDGARLRTWVAGHTNAGTPPVVMVHGGPGLPDYLAPVAELIVDLSRVHRYDQRGIGGSPWDGEHTIARHVRDLELLLDVWGYDRAILIGHSFGTDHADRDCAWGWAHASAQARWPVNYRMNAQLNADKRVDPLESHVKQLRDSLPPGTVIIGGEGDPRPAAFLHALSDRLGCNVTIISDAGHEPWLEKPGEFQTALRAALTATKTPSTR